MKVIANKEELLKCSLDDKVVYENEIYYIEEIHQSFGNKYVIIQNASTTDYIEIILS